MYNCFKFKRVLKLIMPKSIVSTEITTKLCKSSLKLLPISNKLSMNNKKTTHKIDHKISIYLN